MLRRLSSVVALAFGITVVLVLVIHLIPGDPGLVARLNQQLGLDQPLPTQYAVWVGNVLRGDLGCSFVQQQSVSSLIRDNMPATVQLTLASLSLSVGSTVGVFAALRRNRR